MATLRIRLKKKVGDRKPGDVINATPAAIHHAGLTTADYEPIGTHPHPVASDLLEPTVTEKK